nr:VOC family protein [Flavobacterium selenitireducens]
MLGFYTEVIGLRVLGQFKQHGAYSGVFLGWPDSDWELEFTISDEAPKHISDEDDLFAFYFDTQSEIDAIVKRALGDGVLPVQAKNPYWNANATVLPDPEGFLVALALRSPLLTSDGKFSKMATSLGLHDWNSVVEHVRKLPYGRNENRYEFGLVLSEGKGSCSSKHALLKSIANENRINVGLMLGIYKMNRVNTIGIGDTLEASGLEFIPEAHCYLVIDGHRFDFTDPQSDVGAILPDILCEMPIEPDQVADYKIKIHKDFIRTWIASEKIPLDFEAVWKLREKCISRLSGEPETHGPPR